MTILEQDFKSSHSIINGQLIMNPNKGGKPVYRSPADHIRLIIFHDLPHPIRNAESSLKASIAVNVCQTTAQALKTSASYRPSIEVVKNKLLQSIFRYREIMTVRGTDDLLPKFFLDRMFEILDEKNHQQKRQETDSNPNQIP